ncbi:MAG: S41 family peptidase [Lachnospiraceae bacterium]|nr:S41 family peptidase [Lachnospiraceae bacterium]
MRRNKKAAVMVISALVLSLCGCGKKGASGKDGLNILQDKDVAKKVEEINGYIDDEFYFEVDREKQEEAIYDGILAGLDDPYSRYYNSEELAEVLEDTSGKYVGIGAYVTQYTDYSIYVVRPIRESPAAEAGLMPEDRIVEVDGEEIADQDLSLVVEKIRGQENTVAHIKVYRESIKDYIEFDITRREVENYSVDYEMLEGNIGLVTISSFNDNTTDEFIKAVDDLTAAGAKSFIFDLRDNLGGLVSAAANICDYVMDSGLIVCTKDKNGKVLSEYRDKEEHSINVPIVLLVNENSASAAEIMTGALKDSGKAVLVGCNTFGKGIVQSIIPLSDGTAIKITIAKYFTPSGYELHGKGIAPDYEVKLPEDRISSSGLERDKDTQLAKAIELLKDK